VLSVILFGLMVFTEPNDPMMNSNLFGHATSRWALAVATGGSRLACLYPCLIACATATDAASGTALGETSELVNTTSEYISPAIVSNARTKITVTVLMVVLSRLIEAKCVRHLGKKR
jgi:hypothetical protein